MTTTPNLFRYRHRCVHACFAAPEGSGRRHSSIAMALRAVPDRNHLKYDRHVNRISNPILLLRQRIVRVALEKRVVGHFEL
jgi:hypothetical protein